MRWVRFAAIAAALSGTLLASVGSADRAHAQGCDLGLTASPDSGTVPLTVTIEGILSGGSGCVSAIDSWMWDFGDGSSSESASPVASHTYRLPGEYTLTLWTTGTSPVWATTHITATALAPAPRQPPGSAPPPPQLRGVESLFPIPPGTLFAILVTPARYETPALVQELTAAGCNPLVLGILIDGSWVMYVVGAPPVVNEAFPASLASTAPFYVRRRG